MWAQSMQTAENVRSDYDTYLVASVKYLSMLYSKKKIQCLVLVILAKDIHIYIFAYVTYEQRAERIRKIFSVFYVLKKSNFL